MAHRIGRKDGVNDETVTGGGLSGRGISEGEGEEIDPTGDN